MELYIYISHSTFLSALFAKFVHGLYKLLQNGISSLKRVFIKKTYEELLQNRIFGLKWVSLKKNYEKLLLRNKILSFENALLRYLNA